jgi:GGDEF domain-containing protein
MRPTTRPTPVRFAGYHEEAVERILELGVTPSQIEALREYGLLADDNVTGFHEGRSGPGRLATLRRAICHTAQTGQECCYVEMDVQNLGGLNAVLGHTRANEVYAAIAALVRCELSSVAATAVFFRHGGDEMSAVLIGTKEQALQAAFATVRRKVADLARRCQVDDIPHPKHPDDPCWRGTGVCFGMAWLLPEHEHDPTVVFHLADADVARSKCSRDDRLEERR